MRCNPCVVAVLGVVLKRWVCGGERGGWSEARIEVVGGRRGLIPWPCFAPV